MAEAYQTPRRKQEAASQALVISQPPSSHSGSSVNSGYLGPCIGRIPGCLFTDVSHKSCQVMQRWKTKKRRHCTVLFSPPRPRPSSPLKIRPPKQMPGLLSSERSERPARLQQSRLVSGGGCGRGGDAEQRKSFRAWSCQFTQSRFHTLPPGSLKIISVPWLLPRDAKHFSPVGDEGRNVIFVKLHDTKSIEIKACATSQTGSAPACQIWEFSEL